ncbi:ATP-binding protein [Pseudonocardia benzenivorans]
MLVGRASERRTIARLVAAARVGSSGVLLLSGEPGIGKTALLDEAVALATDMRVLRARGAEAEREVPFGGLAQLLRPALGELDRIPARSATRWRPRWRCGRARRPVHRRGGDAEPALPVRRARPAGPRGRRRTPARPAVRRGAAVHRPQAPRRSRRAAAGGPDG